MPFTSPQGAEFEDWDDCVSTLTEDGDMSEEEARQLCGRWQADSKSENAKYAVTVNARDPTRTQQLRSSFQTNVSQRWRQVRGRNRKWIQSLERPYDISRLLPRYRSFVQSFATNTVVESMSEREVSRGRHWTASFVRQAYRQGLQLAESDLEAYRSAIEQEFPDLDVGLSDVQIANATSERSRFHRRRMQSEFQKAFFKLEDHVSTAVNETSDVARTAVENQKPKRWFADESNARISKTVDNQGRAHANVVVVRSVNEALLTSFEQVGIEEVVVAVESSAERRENYAHEHYNPQSVVTVNAAGEVEWVTAADDRVCPACSALDGRVLKISDIRETPTVQPPIHPNCRCRLVPLPMELITEGEQIPVPDAFLEADEFSELPVS